MMNGVGMISIWLNFKCIVKYVDGLNFNCYIV